MAKKPNGIPNGKDNEMKSPNIEKYFEKILKLLKEISDKLAQTTGGF